MTLKLFIMMAVGFAAIVIFCVTYSSYDIRRVVIKKMNRWIADKGLKITEQFGFYNGNFGYEAFVDSSRDLVLLVNIRQNIKEYFLLKEIGGVDIYEDDVMYDNADVKKKIKKLEIVIRMLAGDKEDIRIVLNSDKISTRSKDYKNKMAFALHLQKVMG